MTKVKPKNSAQSAEEYYDELMMLYKAGVVLGSDEYGNFYAGMDEFIDEPAANGVWSLGYGKASVLPADFGEKSYAKGASLPYVFGNEMYADEEDGEKEGGKEHEEDACYASGSVHDPVHGSRYG